MLWTESLVAPFLPQLAELMGERLKKTWFRHLGTLLSDCRFDELPRGVPPRKSGCQWRRVCECWGPWNNTEGAKRQALCILAWAGCQVWAGISLHMMHLKYTPLLSRTSGFSHHYRSTSCLLHSIEAVLEILLCHTRSSVMTGWKSVLTLLILKEASGEGIGKREKRQTWTSQGVGGQRVEVQSQGAIWILWWNKAWIIQLV